MITVLYSKELSMAIPKKKCFLLILVIVVVAEIKGYAIAIQKNTPLKQTHLVLLPTQVKTLSHNKDVHVYLQTYMCSKNKIKYTIKIWY